MSYHYHLTPEILTPEIQPLKSHYHLTPKILTPKIPNGYPTSVLLNKKDGERDDKFLDCALSTATGLCRDEYPYNSTYQGGEVNYNAGKVSVEYVSRSESGRQGNFIKRFYNEVLMNDRDTFLVIPLGPVTGFFNKSGQWNSVPKY